MDTDSDDNVELFDYNPCALIEELPPPEDIASKLRKAVTQNKLDMVKEILEGDYHKVNLTDNNGYTCLHLAAAYGSMDVLRYLLSLKQTLKNPQNFQGETPLVQALRLHVKYEVLECLVNNKCDVTIPNNWGYTPLHFAAKRNIKVAKLFIFNGADVNIKDVDGHTPLHEAVQAQNVKVINMFLYYNASVNEISYYSLCTPFHMAVKSGHGEISNMLIDYVDDFSRKDVDGRTALHLAFANRMPIALEIINKTGESDSLSFENIHGVFTFCYGDPLKWVWYFLSLGVKVKLKDIAYLYDKKGFCDEIEAIFKSETPIEYDSCGNSFVNKLVYNCTFGCDKILPVEKNFYAFSSFGCVPSLLEVARDGCRKYIFNTYQKGGNFKAYNIIMRLRIPQRLKEILILKKPLYNIKEVNNLFCD